MAINSVQNSEEESIDYDVFESVHETINKGQLEIALREVLDMDLAKIRKPYTSDLNHAWYVVGNIYFELSDYSQSLRAFRSAFKSDQQTAHAIGNCYTELGRYKMAERFFKKALSGNESNLELIYNLGNSFLDQDKFVEAMNKYIKVINSKNADENLMIMAKENLAIAKKALSKNKRDTQDKND